MKRLSSIIESKEEAPVTKEEFSKYMDTVGSQLPKDVKTACAYLQKFGISTKEEIEELQKMNIGAIRKAAKEMNASENELKMKLEIRLLPMMQSEEEREDFMSGRKTADDITLDFSTEKGRNAIVKQYTPLVSKIASQFMGKTSLNYAELLSAGMEGLAMAMNDYRKEGNIDDNIDRREEQEKRRASFLQYAAYRIRFRILGDIQQHTYSVHVPRSAKKEDIEGLSRVSISKHINGDGDEIADRLEEISITPEEVKLDSQRRLTDNTIKKVFDLIENRFSKQHAAVFYKTFGLNGYDMMKRSEIAKEMNKSIQNITMINTRIAAFLKQTPEAQPLLKALLQQCQESIFINCTNKSKEEIYEALVSNDMFILLEELTRWSDSSVLSRALECILSQYDNDSVEYIQECLEKGTSFIENTYADNKKLIVHFLENLNPTQSFIKKSDAHIINEMESLSFSYNSKNQNNK